MFTLGLADGAGDNDDLTLSTGSACVDTGNPAAVFNDPNGSNSDMGAYGGPAANW
jgi:hypothetical protein